MTSTDPTRPDGSLHTAGGYGPPGGGDYGAPPGGPFAGPPPGGGGFGAPPGGGFGPPPGGYGFGPPGGGFPPPGGPMMPGAGGDVNTTLPLVLSIVSIFCCGFGTILGIVGVVFALQASNAKKTGDLETARAKAKTSLIVAIVSMALGAIIDGAYGITALLG